jgi:hypothetical protein
VGRRGEAPHERRRPAEELVLQERRREGRRVGHVPALLRHLPAVDLLGGRVVQQPVRPADAVGDREGVGRRELRVERRVADPGRLPGDDAAVRGPREGDPAGDRSEQGRVRHGLQGRVREHRPLLRGHGPPVGGGLVQQPVRDPGLRRVEQCRPRRRRDRQPRDGAGHERDRRVLTPPAAERARPDRRDLVRWRHNDPLHTGDAAVGVRRGREQLPVGETREGRVEQDRRRRGLVGQPERLRHRLPPVGVGRGRERPQHRRRAA